MAETTRWKVYGFLVTMVLLAGGAYLIVPRFTGSAEADNGEQGETAGEGEKAVPVQVRPAVRGDIAFVVSATSNLRAPRQVEVGPRISGVVIEVAVEEGDYVPKGGLLFRLDSSDARIRLETAREQLAQAELQLERTRILQDKADVQLGNTREEYERYRRLYEENLVSEREVAQVRYRLDELEHDLKAAASESRQLEHRVEELKGEIEAAELEISRTNVRAPFAGYVTERLVDAGQSVSALAPAIRLAELVPLEAEVYLAEKDAARVTPGQPATIISGVDASVQARGRVQRVSPVVDEASGTVKVTVLVDSDVEPHGLFKPGAFVRVEIETDQHHDTVLVPKRALREEDGSSFVFVVRSDTARKVPVSTGYTAKDQVELLSGVAPGDQVVVAGQGALKDGSKVRVVESRPNPESVE